MIPIEEGRCERKFLFPLGPEEAGVLLRTHPACFREAFPPRQVNSLYLDTGALDCYRDSLDGLESRGKVRLRWYGDLVGRAGVALEWKRKRGEVVLKRVLRLGDFDLGPRADPRAVDGMVRSAPPAECSALAAFRPVLLIRYRRRYLASPDGRYRATLDSGLAYSPFRPGHAWRLSGSGEVGSVLEFKCPPGHDARLRGMSVGAPFRVSRMSKYAWGMGAAEEALSGSRTS